MAFLLRRIVGMAARRVLFDPRTRHALSNTFRGVATEVRTIARDGDPAKAAGRSIRGVLNRLQNGDKKSGGR